MTFVPAVLNLRPGAQETPTRRSLILAAPFLAAAPAGAIMGIGDKLNPYTVGGVYNVSIPEYFKVKSVLTGDVEITGDPVQRLEGMSCGFLTRKKERNPLIINPDPMALANKISARSYGNSTVVSAKATTVGGVAAYVIEYENQLIHEDLLVSFLDGKGGDGTLCTVSIRTPALSSPTKKETFDKIIASFLPL